MKCVLCFVHHFPELGEIDIYLVLLFYCLTYLFYPPVPQPQGEVAATDVEGFVHRIFEHEFIVSVAVSGRDSANIALVRTTHQAATLPYSKIPNTGFS